MFSQILILNMQIRLILYTPLPPKNPKQNKTKTKNNEISTNGPN
jgi:hypothetical protein